MSQPFNKKARLELDVAVVSSTGLPPDLEAGGLEV
jgi:hypothetical protein